MGAGNWYLTSCEESKLVYFDKPFEDEEQAEGIAQWHLDRIEWVLEATRDRLASFGLAVEECDEWARDGSDYHKIRLVVHGRYGTTVGITTCEWDMHTALAVADLDDMRHAEINAFSTAKWLIEHPISAADECREFAANFGCKPQTYINETERMIDLVYTELIVALDREVSRMEIRLRTSAWTSCTPSDEWFSDILKTSKARGRHYSQRKSVTSQEASV